VAQFREPVRLIAPPRELTQTAPNKGRVGKEFDLESLQPRPPVFMPPSLPPGAVPSGRPVPLPEPPKIDIGQAVRPSGVEPAALPPPPPQIQPEEKPKLAFETPRPPETKPPGTSKFAAPPATVSEMGRALSRDRTSSGLVVSDLEPGLGGATEGLNVPPSPGAAGNSLELLSDPKGVDFKPYLQRILASVKRNWQSVIPESAKRGQVRGRVAVQFSVSRDGKILSLKIASPSGMEALDLAAIAGISASNPFPPLPAEYNGLPIRLQFVFLYNMRSQ
jgi:TonB family protein